MIKYRTLPVLAFLIPLAVRAIPEILIGPYVIGFDTLGYYVPNVLTWLRYGVDYWHLIAVAPLFYTILLGVTSLGIPIVITLKVMPPLFHGLLGLTVFFYARKALSWSPKKSLLMALVGTLYFVALRISWDMLRNELGLIFLFIVLAFLQGNVSHRKHSVFLSLAMLSVVLAHPLVAIVMFAIVAATIIHLLLDRKTSEMRRLIMTCIPALFLLVVVISANYTISPSFSVVSGFPVKESEGWSALFGHASYFDMMANTLGFMVFCYLPLLPLVLLSVKLLRDNLQMKAWSFWIFIAISSALVSPSVFVPGLHRWTLMLIYPFAFYATDALSHFKPNLYRLIACVLLVTLTAGFIMLPNEAPFPYYTFFPYHMPTSMLQNTVSSSDCQDTVNVLQWLGSNMHDNTRLLAHDIFYGWALLTLGDSRIIPIGYGNPEKMAEEMVQNGSFDQLYLIWWTEGNGWHGQPTVSSSFEEIYESGKIAVFTYKPIVHHSDSDSEDLRSIKS
ncbi:MAG: hypothetical protein PVF15_00815 [Candidatus Bathyarchaeota archaeon]